MREPWISLNSGMGRRLLLAFGTALAVVLVAAVGLNALDSVSRQEQIRRQGLEQAASSIAAAVSARLSAAAAIAASLAGDEPGPTGQALRSRVKRTGAFNGVFLLDPDASGRAQVGSYTFRFTGPQLATLLAGGSALLTIPLDAQFKGLFLARATSDSGRARIAAFELSPDWLWSPMHDAPSGLTLVALDARGASIQGGEVAPDLAALLASGLGGPLRTGAARSLGWQSQGEAWEGSMAGLTLADATTSAPIGLVAADRRPAYWSSLAKGTTGLPLLLLIAVVTLLVTAARFLRHYAPFLRALPTALGRLGEPRVWPLALPSVDEELRPIVERYNEAATGMAQRLSLLHWQAEIDELLLGAGELESVLGQVLGRVREVMRARAVGLTLIDADTTGYGRLFAACQNDTEWPVIRVSLDAALVDLFAASPDGLTIARCEEQRHSLLMPLAAAGAQFFWAWPVFAGERVAAILAVGYGEAPRLDTRLASQGADCARRFGTVLSRGARAEHLYRQAHFDALTQLPNRLLFRDRLDQALSAASAATARGALLYIDLDHFKKVNDSVGHAAGDQLLAIVGQRLRGCIKEGDTVARLAGDEFTVILQKVDEPAAAMTIARRISESLQRPVNLGGRDHQVRASIGIALFPDDGAGIDELMRNADLAMYRAKDQGRGGATFFDRTMMPRDARPADTGLYRALKRREFALFYQPQYSLADGSLLGVEALLRWDSPRGGLRSPSEFVPAAEESGLIVDIGGWVLEAACAQLASWRQQGLTLPRMAVNISTQQLQDNGCVLLLKRLLDKYGLAADLLELELTESAFTDPEAEAALQALSRLGVRLTLDDFGTGYSALNHLRRYPVSTVKIDRSFIDDVAENPASATLAEAIIAMAHTLGKQVVAEGVETIEQLDFLRERGCDAVQGYYLARPLTVTAMSQLLVAREPAREEHATAAAG